MHPVLQGWDLDLLLTLRSYHGQVAIWAAWVFASLAWKGVIFWIMAAVFWLRGHRVLAAQFVLALCSGTLAIICLKGTVLRPRPDLYAARELNIPMPELMPTLHSFPSGHTLLAAAVMMIVFNRYRDWRVWAFASFVLLVGLSRLYQGMHWPTDIIGSVILGVVAGILAIKVSELPLVRRLIKDRSPEPATPALVASSEKQKETAGVR